MRVLVVAVSGAPDRQPSSAGLACTLGERCNRPNSCGPASPATRLLRLEPRPPFNRSDTELTSLAGSTNRAQAQAPVRDDQNRQPHLGRFFILSASFGGLEWTKKPKTFTRSCKRDSPDRGRFHHRTRNGLDRSGINGLLDALNLRILVGFKARAGMGGGNHPQLS